MGTRSRMTLLMLTAILGKGAPMRPPGGPSGVPHGPGMANCPIGGEQIDTRVGNLYWCEDHSIWFDSDGNVYDEAGS
jgi:hypothetical protein